jgi:gamma-glutamyltranspeptidase/glutathione hydrolase
MAKNIVATSQPLAVQAGLRMLVGGGSAVDAALAAAITLTVVEPTGNGLGSDAFAIVWDGGELHGLNASGASPAGWSPERFAGRTQMPHRGWESVTVPGAVSAWQALSERFGKLPFRKLFAPAIAYARDGFAVSPIIATLWASGAAQLADQPGFRDHFMPGGRAPAAGEIFRNPDLAKSLEAIARTRGDAFYRGALGRRIARDAKKHKAALTMADLEEHAAEWSGTIATRFRGADLHEIPPNGQGIAALIALGILEHTRIDELDPDGAEALHLEIEAMKLAFADVDRCVADRRHMTVAPESLLEPSRLAELGGRIDPARAALAEAAAPARGGTVYVAAADASGMMVSYIQSNYSGFGSGVVVPGAGVHLQNRGSGFVTTAGHPNEVGPRKRPLHTIIPGFLMRDGRPLMAFGVMGGPMQAQGHVQLVLRTQVFGQNPQLASDAPRWRFVSGRRVAVEWALPLEVVAALEAKGHEIVREPPDAAFGFGGAQLIHVLDDGYIAGSDHRKDGQAAGF